MSTLAEYTYTPAERAAYGRKAQAIREAERAARLDLLRSDPASMAATDAFQIDRQAEAREYTYAGCRAMLADRAAEYDREAGAGKGRLLLDAVIEEGWYAPLKAAAADLLVKRVEGSVQS